MERSADDRCFDDLLRRTGEGDDQARDALLELIYDDLHAVARRRLRGERAGHTWSATDLLHECYSRMLPRLHSVQPSDRQSLLSIAHDVMRKLLIDYARRRKRRVDGAWKRAAFDVVIEQWENERSVKVEALLDAMESLKIRKGERPYQIVMLRFFYGMTRDEAAAALGCSVRTADKDWDYARVFLREFLEDQADDQFKSTGNAE